jgi:hypothetical protein
MQRSDYEDAYEPDTTLDGDSVLSVFVAIWWASSGGRS